MDTTQIGNTWLVSGLILKTKYCTGSKLLYKHTCTGVDGSDNSLADSVSDSSPDPELDSSSPSSSSSSSSSSPESSSFSPDSSPDSINIKYNIYTLETCRL